MNALFELFNTYVNSPLFVLAVGSAYAARDKHRKRQLALSKNIYRGDEALVTSTHLEPFGDKRLQRIQAVQTAFEVGSMFHANVRLSDLSTMRRAAKLCEADPDESNLFKFFYQDGFLPEKELEAFRARLRGGLKSRFSEVMYPYRDALRSPQQQAFLNMAQDRFGFGGDENSEAGLQDLAERYMPLHDEYHAAFVIEEHADIKRLRIFIVPKLMLDYPELFADPDAKLAYINNDGTVNQGAHHHSERMPAIQAFLSDLRESQELRDDTYFYLKSGIYLDAKQMPDGVVGQPAVLEHLISG